MPPRALACEFGKSWGRLGLFESVTTSDAKKKLKYIFKKKRTSQLADKKHILLQKKKKS